jgi:hypothetical protein
MLAARNSSAKAEVLTIRRPMSAPRHQDTGRMKKEILAQVE